MFIVAGIRGGAIKVADVSLAAISSCGVVAALPRTAGS